MKPKILSIGYAVPPTSYTQEEVFNQLGYPKPFWRLFRESGIKKRHFWLPLDTVRKLSFQEQQEVYISAAPPLSIAAISECLDGRKPDRIGCLVYCSCTGFCPGPTVGHQIAKFMQLSPSVYHTNIASMGCEGAFPGVRRAYDFTNTTKSQSLVVACELTCCTYFPEGDKPDPENDYELLRANAIFADAAVAVLIGYDEDWRHPTIVDMETFTNTDYIDALGFTWRNGRLRVLLSRDVPKIAPQVVLPAVGVLLARNGLYIKDIQWFIIHAAGGAILDNIRDALKIPEEKLALSRATLENYGNTSSTSVGITGKSLVKQNIQLGDFALVISVGPGMTGGATLLQFI